MGAGAGVALADLGVHVGSIIEDNEYGKGMLFSSVMFVNETFFAMAFTKFKSLLFRLFMVTMKV